MKSIQLQILQLKSSTLYKFSVSRH